MRNGRSLGLVGKQYCKLHGFLPSSNNNAWNYFERLHQTSKWGLKLQQYGIPGKGIIYSVFVNNFILYNI